jgi:hypothetical protein
MTAAEVAKVFLDWERMEEDRTEDSYYQRTGTFFIEPLPKGHSAGMYKVTATNTKSRPNPHRGLDGEGI